MNAPDMAFADKLKGYSDSLSLAQVVTFFERHGILFTKTMIQNYVRVEVLPPPLNKRFYTKKHLLLLYMIDNLKNIFSLDEIKRAFSPVLSMFDECDMVMVYNCYAQFYENSITEYAAWREGTKAEVERIADDGATRGFLLNLSMMTAALAAKETVTRDI